MVMSTIRIRRQNGDVIPIPDSAAVEILGDDGGVAVVITTDRKGTIRVIVPPDPLFNAYCRTQGAKQSARVHVHTPFDGKPMG
jgi:hypothetical protein